MVGFGIIAAGGVYWLVWAVVLPKLGNYRLEREVVVDDIDGWEKHVFKRVPNSVPVTRDLGHDDESTNRTDF